MSKGMKAIHTRIIVGGVVLLLGLVAWLYETSGFAARP
jgi:hypothetical protein